FQLMVMIICFSDVMSQSKFHCGEYLKGISKSWKADSLGYNGIRLRMYQTISECKKSMHLMNKNEFLLLFGKYRNRKLENNEEIIYYPIYDVPERKHGLP